ncbi:MAG: LysR family transcriptional regulator [Acidimicrobiales bacterium]
MAATIPTHGVTPVTAAPAPPGLPWPALELRHLMALVAVAESGSFSRAAEWLGYTQSAVSQQIGMLERIVGTSLFERPGGPRPVQITPAGETLLGHARAVLARVSTAATDLRALESGERGELRVGTMQSVGTKILPRLLRGFRTDWPGIEVTLYEAYDCDDLLRKVEAGELDLSFIELEVLGDAPLDTRWLLDDPLVFVAPADAPEANRSSVRADEIVGLPMIGIRNAGCQSIIDECFHGLADRPTYVFRSDDNPTVQGCISSGLGYAVLPLLAVDENDPTVAVIPIKPPAPPRRLGVAWHANRRPSPALAPFIDAAAEICDDLAEKWASRRTMSRARARRTA